MSTTVAIDKPSTKDPGKQGKSDRVGPFELVRRNILLVALVIMVILFESLTGHFLSAGNLRSIALDIAVLLIVAVPAALLLISGFVDFSVGSTIGLSAVFSGILMTAGGVNPLTAGILTLLLGALIGAVNGFLVTYGKLSPIIVTMGMLSVLAGITLGVGGRPTVGYPDTFGLLGRTQVLGVPIPIIIAIVILGLGLFVAYRMPVGRHLYAIGSNRNAAFLTGIRVNLVPFSLYIVVGVASALGGLVMASRLNSAAAGMGSGFEIEILTALLLGGVSFFGGRGSLFGVLVAVLFVGALRGGLSLVGVENFWQQVATGVALVLAAVLNYFSEKR